MPNTARAKKLKRADPLAVDRLLLSHYGPYRTPTHPRLLDELLYFMLSTRTTTPACDAAFRAFKRSSPWTTPCLCT